MRRFVRRPSPSMAVACFALFVALGGVGIAAASLPRNSVGTRQLRNNAVTSSKVKNHSLLKADFKLGQLPLGARGTTGPPGARGATGGTGAKGDTGPRGPSDAYSTSVAGPVAMAKLTLTILASLSLPAGKYIIFAKAYFDADPGNLDTVQCILRAEGDSDTSYATVYKQLSGASDQPQTLTANVLHEYGTGGTADLICGSTDSGTANNVVISAIKVAALTKS
jgi:hypothetical protein